MVDGNGVKRKIEEAFLRVTRDELLFLRQTLRIGNLPYIYMALRVDYPRELRGEFKVDVKKFLLAWGIPRSSFYKSIAEMDELKVLSITSVDVHLYWRDAHNSTLSELSQIRDSSSDPRQKSQIRDSQSQIRDKKSSKTLLEKSSSNLQISTDLYRFKEEREENNFLEENSTCGKLASAEQESNLADLNECQVLKSTISENPSDTLDYTLEDQASADGSHANFKTYVSFESEFEPEACNWSEYAGPGFGGSPSEYYVYRRAKVLLLAQERQRQHDEGNRKANLIPEIDAYTRAVVKNGGANEFDDWVRIGKPTEPVLQPASVNGARRKQTASAASANSSPLLTPAQVLENRKRSLMILYESSKFDDMHELLDRWLSLKDGIVPQLLKQCPEWGFSLKRDRVVRLEAVEA